MTTVPPYRPPFVDAAGLHVNTYPSIFADNLQGFLNIFGLNQYVATDSAIYQLLSLFSLKHADANLGLQLAYNQTSPQTAVGAGLDRVVKMNGLARAAYSFSTAPLILNGSNLTVLTNCFAQDQNGNLWSIPSGTVIIGSSVNVTATCTTPGAVSADAGTITIRATPVNGWTSVTNPAAAVTGKPVETDSQLRARQSISVARPSLTRLQSTIADVLAVAGVKRINPGTPTPGGPGTSIENPTGSTDSWGNPSHSISMVVEGGTDLDVATAIYGARGIGPFTNGTTAVPITDPNSGYVMSISFFRPTSKKVAVFISVTALTGYTTATKAAIQKGVVDYLNSLSIGESVVYSELYGAALTARPNPDQPLFSITSLTSGSETAATQAALTSSSPNAVVVSGAGIAPGQFIRDEDTPGNIPDGTTVVSITGTALVMSNNAVASAAADHLSFFTMGTTDLALLYTQVAEGDDANVVVTP